MKVCYLGENASVHNQKWIEALRHHVDLHVISFDRGIKYEGVQYHILREYTGTKLDFILNINVARQLIKSIGAHLIHAQYATSYGFLGAICNFHPLIITGWGADIFDSPRNPLMRFIIKNSLSKADALTVLSEFTRKEMKKLTNKEIELIPFGIDIEKFKPVKRSDDGYFRIGTVRTLSSKYGVEYLLRAFAKIHLLHPDIILDIVGDGPLKSSLQDLCIDLKINEKVVFHGYINQQTDFEKYYSLLSSMDIFVIPSILNSETFGVACVEASACEIPVIASDVGGLPEVVKHGRTGLIVTARSIDQISTAIEKLYLNSNLRTTMGVAGREDVIMNYNWRKNVHKMVELYRSLS